MMKVEQDGEIDDVIFFTRDKQKITDPAGLRMLGKRGGRGMVEQLLRQSEPEAEKQGAGAQERGQEVQIRRRRGVAIYP